MARTITIGNGNLLIGIDRYGQVRDLYFPFAGHANHVSGASGSYKHRIGVWIDGVLRWLDHSSWEISIVPEPGSIIQSITAHNHELGVTIIIRDVVHNEAHIFLREVTVHNLRDYKRTIKVFFAQEFRITESRRGDTAFYDPRVQSLIHYKGHVAFLIHASDSNVSFTEYSIGLFGIEGKEGTYLDAEDGVLSKNSIEHGSVDSVLSLEHEYEGCESRVLYYWIAVGQSIAQAHEFHTKVLTESPKDLITSSSEYWDAWLHKEDRDLAPIEKTLQDLYERSLRVIRIHADNRGGIIASSDSDILNQGRDTYSYVWPRDASVSANALDRAGYFDISQRYFSFLEKLLEKDGYLMHKYRVDGVLGSSWHPWLRNGVFELPIQEDETAISIYMLAQHYEYARDIEFIESLYNPFIEPVSDFLCSYIDEETGLPKSSYDLWEEKFGMSTYTAGTVFGALQAAAQLSELLGKDDNASRYRNQAESIKKAIFTHLYNEETKTFLKLVRYESGTLVKDTTLDMSSLHGLIQFGVLDPFDVRIQSMVQAIEARLKVPTSYGGYMRYERDRYYKISDDAPPNAWCITTLWMAQFYIKSARTKKDLKHAYTILSWIHDRATQSGILPEQINPYTGEHLSTSPLVWSHAEFIITVDEYLKKHAKLS